MGVYSCQVESGIAIIRFKRKVNKRSVSSVVNENLFQFLSEVVDTVELHLCPTSSGSGYGVPQQQQTHPSVPSDGGGYSVLSKVN